MSDPVRSADREADLCRLLVDAAPVAMVVVDRDGRIVLVNARLEGLFGYTRDELIGKSAMVLVPERYHQARTLQMADDTLPLAGSLGLPGALFARRKDHTEIPVDVSYASVPSSDGVLVTAAIRDVSEHHRVEQQADHAKDEFFATVSHELRTPLTSLIGYGELLGDLEELSPQGRRFLSVMMRSAQRELRLVDDLLILGQIEESGLNVRPAPIDLGAVVNDAVEAARPRAEEAQIELQARLPVDVVPVEGDSDRLGQALDNLLINAIKFTPAGGIVRAALEAGDDGAVIEVSDTGPGVGVEHPERVFERLYRGSAAVQDHVPGAGLGLTITLAIVDAHHGTITIPRSDEHGSVFRVALPLLQIPASA